MNTANIAFPAFPEGFFEAETRDGFQISATMKKAWAIQLTVLSWVKEIADRHSIPFWLDYGSLLGAVRHKGYVPWDDDIDICMLRADYMRILPILEKELPPFCRVRSLYNTADYDNPKAFISCRDKLDTDDTPAEREITALYFGLPYVTGIDLYPLDFVPKDQSQWNLTRQVYIAIYDLAMRYDSYKESGELEGFASQIEELLHVTIPRDEHMKNALWKLADNVSMMTAADESDSVLWYPDAAMRDNDMRRALTSYEETIITDFEMLKMPIPKGYDQVLTACYFDSYMTPIQAPASHDYPFYREQQDFLDRKKALPE